MAVFLRLFGGLFLENRKPLRFRTQATGSLFAYLTYHAGKPQARDELVETFWPGRTVSAGRNSLSLALSSLRRFMDDVGVPPSEALYADRATVCLSDAFFSTDVMIFKALLHAGLWNGSPHDAAPLHNAQAEAQQGQLREALALYRGPLLAGDDSEWILGERSHLHLRFEIALHHIARLREAVSDWEDALHLCFQAVQAAPFSEEAQTRLIETSLRAGRPGLAVAQYEKYARLLEDSNDTPPDALAALLAPYRGIGTAAAGKKILTKGVPSRPHKNKAVTGSTFSRDADVRRRSPFPDALPTEDNDLIPSSVACDFFGRQDDVRHLLGVLWGESPQTKTAGKANSGKMRDGRSRATAAAGTPPACRLVVLLGTCGIGKTRLAAEVARASIKSRVYFFPPRYLSASAFTFVLAQTLGISRGTAYPWAVPEEDADDDATRAKAAAWFEDTVVERLQTPTLLVLDSFDEVIQQDKNALPFLYCLLRRAPRVSCLLTARARFDVPHDDESENKEEKTSGFTTYEYWVPPLSVPPASGQVDAEASEAEVPLEDVAYPVLRAADPHRLMQQFPSMALLTARANAAMMARPAASPSGETSPFSIRAAFRLTTNNCAAVAALCRELGGLPLGLEIAGAAMAFLSPMEVLARLHREREDAVMGAEPPASEGMAATGQTDYKTFLSDVTALPFPVQQAVQAAFHGLSGEARRMLCLLSAFQGGWTINAAQAVVAPSDVTDVLRLMTELRDAALIVPVASSTPFNHVKSEADTFAAAADASAADVPRWDTLPPVRLFARRMAAKAEANAPFWFPDVSDMACRTRHARYFADFAETTPHFWRRTDERENLSAALGWCVKPKEETESEAEWKMRTVLAFRLIGAGGGATLASGCVCSSENADEKSGHNPTVAAEWERAADTLVEQHTPSACPISVLLLASRWAFGRGDIARAVHRADEALRRVPQNAADAVAQRVSRAYRGFLACWTGDVPVARQLLQGDNFPAPQAVFFQSLLELWDGDMNAARDLAQHFLRSAQATTKTHGEIAAAATGAFFVLASASAARAADALGEEAATERNKAEVFVNECLTRFSSHATCFGSTDKRLMGLALNLLAALHSDTQNDAGRATTALRLYRRAFRLSQQIGCEQNRALTLEGLGQVAWKASGFGENAALASVAPRFWGAAAQGQQKSGVALRLPFVLREKAAHVRTSARTQMGATIYDAQHFIGMVLTDADVAALLEALTHAITTPSN